LPSLSELGYALAWKASTSCGAMGLSLNHKVTLRYGSTRNATAQWFRENFSPAMTPVAVHFACAWAVAANVERQRVARSNPPRLAAGLRQSMAITVSSVGGGRSIVGLPALLQFVNACADERTGTRCQSGQ
jgi:hypothetical protein